ncbi:MAG TPA: hypothetical protein VM534_01810 [Thermoanaerobaculia bacterium]|nr:hypothetical protein [Thermoanaerobaculia bacterium]
MNPRDVRRWAENHRAAARREIEERRNRPIPPDQAYRYALALLRFDEARNGPPFERHDPVSARDDQRMREAWAKLRRRWK